MGSRNLTPSSYPFLLSPLYRMSPPSTGSPSSLPSPISSFPSLSIILWQRFFLLQILLSPYTPADASLFLSPFFVLVLLSSSVRHPESLSNMFESLVLHVSFWQLPHTPCAVYRRLFQSQQSAHQTARDSPCSLGGRCECGSKAHPKVTLKFWIKKLRFFLGLIFWGEKGVLWSWWEIFSPLSSPHQLKGFTPNYWAEEILFLPTPHQIRL